MTSKNYYSKEYDLHNCDKEPLHEILRVQSYGSFICCDTTFDHYYYISENIKEEVEDQGVKEYVRRATGLDLYPTLADGHVHIDEDDSLQLCIVHKRADSWLVELEPHPAHSEIKITPNHYQQSLLSIGRATTEEQLFKNVVMEIRRIISYDHVMIYRFEPDGSGEIIAEEKIDCRPAFLGYKFPATDIPKQARELFYKEKIRIIHNIHEEYILEVNDKSVPVDLNGIAMRGVSPIHVEYLSNMGVQASFSVAIIKDGLLWGLIACHNTSAKLIHRPARDWLLFFSDYVSVCINNVINQQIKLVKAETELISSQMLQNIETTKDLQHSLLFGDNNIADIIACDTAAFVDKKMIETVGGEQIHADHKSILTWLDSQSISDVMYWDSLHEDDATCPLPKTMAGLLAVRLSPLGSDYILWMRRAREQSVTWMGDPTQAKVFDHEKGRMSPRKSFDAWNEIVHNSSQEWNSKDISMATGLREALRNKLYERYSDAVLLNKQLHEAYTQMETFSYSISHDLKAPLRSIEEFTRILKDDYGSALDQYGIKLLDTIMSSIGEVRKFIHDIVAYNKANNHEVVIRDLDLNTIITQKWKMVAAHDPNAKLEILDSIPTVYADKILIQQSIQNILSNSYKYVEKDKHPHIRVSYKNGESYLELHIEDNGLGIPAHLREKVFKEFKRIHALDQEGSGLGLSMVRRSINRHGGTVKIYDPKYFDQGTLIILTLPNKETFKASTI